MAFGAISHLFELCQGMRGPNGTNLENEDDEHETESPSKRIRLDERSVQPTCLESGIEAIAVGKSDDSTQDKPKEYEPYFAVEIMELDESKVTESESEEKDSSDEEYCRCYTEPNDNSMESEGKYCCCETREKRNYDSESESDEEVPVDKVKDDFVEDKPEDERSLVAMESTKLLTFSNNYLNTDSETSDDEQDSFNCDEANSLAENPNRERWRSKGKFNPRTGTWTYPLMR